ncbi:MAG: amidohydrolase [Oscillospiraceae bacterium]|nr:amidohydrolase [Oscillospiraceae bacterium]
MSNLLAKDFFTPQDAEYIISVRREIHRHPELGFDTEHTLGIIERELNAMDIPYTRKYGKGSLVGYVGKDEGFTVAIRADIDALPLQEKTGLPFSSEIDGVMHACGHDAHPAMLLGTARALKRAEAQLGCRVKLIFQPNEEGWGKEGSGAAMMCKNGVMDDVNLILGVHVENWLESGKIGVCPGNSMAACHPYTIEFFGRTAHATLPQSGRDTLAMAVSAYNDIYLMKAREINPFENHIISISSLQAGHTHNVIPDYAKMTISVRTFDMKLDEFIKRRITEICERAAAERGGTCKVTDSLDAMPIINDPKLSALVLKAAATALGEDRVTEMPVKLSSEDFSFYMAHKPGVFMRLGTRNEEKGCVTLPHNNDFLIDEDAFISASMTCVQFVLDNMNGIEGY